MSTATTLPTPAHSVNGASQQDVVMTDDSPHNKRKRSAEDDGDRAPKKVHVEDHKLGIDDLHVDVGAKYLLCHKRKPLRATALPLGSPRAWTCGQSLGTFALEQCLLT